MKIKMGFSEAFDNSAEISIDVNVPSRQTFRELADRLWREHEALNKIRLGQTHPDAIHIDVVGANKIQVIKAIREITSLGIKEAKDLTEIDADKRWVPVPEGRLGWAHGLLTEAGATVTLGVSPKPEAR